MSHAKNDEQTGRKERGEESGVLFTPIKLPELICNWRLFASTFRIECSSEETNRTSRSDPVRRFREQNISS